MANEVMVTRGYEYLKRNAAEIKAYVENPSIGNIYNAVKLIVNGTEDVYGGITGAGAEKKRVAIDILKRFHVFDMAAKLIPVPIWLFWIRPVVARILEEIVGLLIDHAVTFFNERGIFRHTG